MEFTIANCLLLLLRVIVSHFKAILWSILPNKLRPKKNIRGQIVLVTGGGSGFGRLLAIGFSQLGCKVIICDINQTNNDETCRLIKKSGGEAWGYVCNVSSKESVYEMARKITDEIGHVSILVNNAGTVSFGYLQDTPDEDIEKVMGVNIMAHFWTTKAFLPHMLEVNQGHLVQLASIAGIVGLPKTSPYVASKHAVMGLSSALSQEMVFQGKDGVRTTVACPYFSQTGLFQCSFDGAMPMVPAEDVSEAIINGVLTNQEIVFIPGWFGLIRYLLPTGNVRDMVFSGKIFIGEKIMNSVKV